MANIQSIIDDFEIIDDWEDRYKYVIDLGKQLPALNDGEKTDEYKVQGCVSQVWLIADVDHSNPDLPILNFRGDSDAHIVRGLVAIMLIAFSGLSAKEIGALDENQLFEKLGLVEHLTPQRANGLRSMVARIKQHAANA
jgi:cysteine desulfuration protein SufE